MTSEKLLLVCFRARQFLVKNESLREKVNPSLEGGVGEERRNITLTIHRFAAEAIESFSGSKCILITEK